MKKFFSLLLTLAMIFTMVIGGTGLTFAASGTTEATTMKIAGTDGTVTITTDKGKDIAAKVDTKLLNGYTIKTAAASYCFISLDDSKAIKLGQNTKVKVEKSGKKIELDVKSGEIYFDVDKKLSGNESMNIKTGNMTTGIRGTSGVTIVSHNMYSITPDASGIKPQETASNTLFQLFSGSTVVKENNPTSLKSLLGRLLSAVPGSGAKINPIKTPGPITAQAGQQIAIAAAPKGGGETTASRFETQALAVNEFGARAVLEAAAIKTGMSAGEALTVGTAQIVAQVGEGLTQTLVAAGVAQAAVTQVAEAASDPAKLDSAKQNAELQAALAELTNTETIDTAKQVAANVEGTKTNDKALEKVDVKTEAGANAGDLKLSDDGTSTSATAGSGSTSTGGHSGGSSSSTESWLRGYTGVYDGQAHDVLAVMSDDNGDRAQIEQYAIWVFDAKENDKPNGPYTGIYQSLQESYDAEVKRVTDSEEEYTDEAATGAILESLRGIETGRVTDDGSPYSIANVNQSGTYYFFAIKNDNYKEVHKGSFNASISRAKLAIKWVLESDAYTEATQGAIYPTTTTTIPVRPVIGVVKTNDSGERFIPAGTELFAGTDTLTTDGVSQEVSFAPAMAGIAPTGAGNYTAQVSSIISGASSDSPLYGVTQTDNYYWPGTNKTYSYTVSDGSTGSANDPGGSTQEPRNILESEYWDDYTKYDVAYIKPSNSDNYSEYRRGVLQGEEGTMPYDYVLRALQSTGASEDMPYFGSIYWDMGQAAMNFSGLDVNNINIYAGANDKAILISGGGVTGVNTLSLQSSGAGKVYLRADNNRRTVAINCQTLTVGENTEFTNYGEVTYSSTFNVYGTVDNFRYVTNTGDNAAGIGVVGGKYMQHNILSNVNGSYTKDIRTDSSGIFVLSNRGEVHMYGGQLISAHNSEIALTMGSSKLSYALSTIFGSSVYGDGSPMQTTLHSITFESNGETMQAAAYKCSYNTENGSISGAYQSDMGTTLSSGIMWVTDESCEVTAVTGGESGNATISFPTKYINTAQEAATGSGG